MTKINFLIVLPFLDEGGPEKQPYIGPTVYFSLVVQKR